MVASISPSTEADESILVKTDALSPGEIVAIDEQIALDHSSIALVLTHDLLAQVH